MTILDMIKQLKQAFDEDCAKQIEPQQLQKKYQREALKQLFGELKTITDPEQKKELGLKINELKTHIETRLATQQALGAPSTEKQFFDPAALKTQIKLGKKHPLMQFAQLVVNAFVGMGFSIEMGPEIEIEANNFEKLNIPPHHPARDMQDTFYLKEDDKLLRSHTSSVQIRAMEKMKPPLKIISLGNVYRVDDIDAQHTPMFFQLEGLVVDKYITFADLKGVLTEFMALVFGDRVKVRFRPSYYPYTEPSAAVDMSCIVCHQKGCRTCKDSGWITVLGSGMVHPNVFRAVSYDPKKYTGFAFGIGINRLAMIYYQMAELRGFYENDISLWRQI